MTMMKASLFTRSLSVLSNWREQMPKLVCMIRLRCFQIFKEAVTYRSGVGEPQSTEGEKKPGPCLG